MKKHHCSRCKKHVSEVFEIARKTGSVRTFCTTCIETMKRKGATMGVLAPASDERRRQRRAAGAGDRR